MEIFGRFGGSFGEVWEGVWVYSEFLYSSYGRLMRVMLNRAGVALELQIFPTFRIFSFQGSYFFFASTC